MARSAEAGSDLLPLGDLLDGLRDLRRRHVVDHVPDARAVLPAEPSR